jgi:hypothetical protein
MLSVALVQRAMHALLPVTTVVGALGFAFALSYIVDQRARLASARRNREISKATIAIVRCPACKRVQPAPITPREIHPTTGVSSPVPCADPDTDQDVVHIESDASLHMEGIVNRFAGWNPKRWLLNTEESNADAPE